MKKIILTVSRISRCNALRGFRLFIAAVAAVLTASCALASDCPLRIDWGSNALSRFSAYDEFTADLNASRTEVLLRTERTVKDLHILELQFESADDDGRIKFAVTERPVSVEFTPERPLLVRMTFIGSIPNYGVSYVDDDGSVRCFSIGESGEDGSLFLSEF